MENRYFLDQDQSGHWYVIPVMRRPEWEEWNRLDEDDERAWSSPAWARILGRHPNQFSFSDFR